MLLAFGCGLGSIGWAGLLFRHIEAHLLCQVLHGLYKASAGVVHQETNGVAVLTAAKAMVELFAGAD